MLFKILYQCCHRRGFLSDSYINTIYRFSCLVETTLIDNSVDSDGSLTSLTVTNNELSLASSDRNHRVYSFQSRLKRLFYWLTVDYTGSLSVKRHLERICEVNIAKTVDSFSQRIDNAPKEVVIDPNGSNTVCTLHALSFLDASSRS